MVMHMSETVQIEVMGQKYSLKGTHDRAYVKRVEQFINKKIQEIKGAGASITSYNLIVLVALNLVDDYLQKEDEVNKLRDFVENKADGLISLIDSHV